MELLLWETEFYALSVVTGEVERFSGTYVEAYTLQDALKSIRKLNLNYLQLTGTWFDTAQDILTDEAFYEKLTDPANIVKGMSYDDFQDWLDLALTRDDLVAALERFKKEKGLMDYVKVIEAYIKNYDEKDGKEDNSKESPDEEVG